jgi:hypothetical protein
MRTPVVIDVEGYAIEPRSDYGKVQKFCLEHDVRMPIVEGNGMITEEIYEDGFLFRPLWLETHPIPQEGIELVRGLYEAGVEFEGFFVVHETPWSFMEDRPQVPLEQVKQVVDARKPEEKPSTDSTELGRALLLALGIAVVGSLLFATANPAPSLPSPQPTFRPEPRREYYLDPLLVGILRDSGTRVVCYAWLEEF